jgi:hypothetical protein
MLLLKALFVVAIAICSASVIMLVYLFTRLFWLTRSLDSISQIAYDYLCSLPDEELRAVQVDDAIFTPADTVVDTFYRWDKWFLLVDCELRTALINFEKERKSK